MIEGYQRAFKQPRTRRNKFAYLSVGPNLEATRFHFADAAVRQIFAGTDDLDKLFKESTALLRTVSNGLIAFIVTYIGERQRGLTATRRTDAASK